MKLHQNQLRRSRGVGSRLRIPLRVGLVISLMVGACNSILMTDPAPDAAACTPADECQLQSQLCFNSCEQPNAL